MGINLFKSKTAKKSGKEGSDRLTAGGSTEQVRAKASRRVVAPVTGTHTAPAKDGPKAVVQAGTKRQSSKSLSVGEQPVEVRPVSGSAPTIRQSPAASKDIEVPVSSSSQARPKSRDPITAGGSEPPKFSGGLGAAGARKGGLCRTGDATLLNFLQSKGLLSEEQVGQVRGKSDHDSVAIDVAAVELGFITEDQMVNALTSECYVPHLRVDKYEIRKKAIDTISREDAVYYGVFPVDKLGSLLTLAMVNPLDAETIRVLDAKTSLDIKKVVATRSEIMKGIEKYYSGQVRISDTSRSFSQDIEPKSVTQMMSRVGGSAPVPASSQSNRSKPSPPPAAPQASNIVPEIQDIDDLLSSDEAIAPAIIEPISLKADAEIVPLEEITPLPFAAEPAPMFTPEIEIPQLATPDEVPVPAPAAAGTESFVDEPDTAIHATGPVLTRKNPPPVAAPPAGAPPSERILAPEFVIDPGTAAGPGAAIPAAPQPGVPAPVPAPAPAEAQVVRPVARPAPRQEQPSAPAPRIAAPPAPAPVRSPPAPASAQPAAAAQAAGAAAPPAPGRSTATKSFTGTGRSGKKAGVVNLIPVMEEEFQHAITHGKSHVFEKWVGLQSRNRIINAQAIENEFVSQLPDLFATPRRI